MIEQDKKGFKAMMNTVMSIYQKPQCDQDTLRVWWAKLERYDFQIVTKAFDQWVDSSKHAPTVFDILNLVRPKIEFQAALQAPKLTLDQNRMHAANVMQYVSENTPKEKKLKGMREWAHKILKNPKNRRTSILRITMIEQDKKGFKAMMNTVMSIYQKPQCDQDTLRVWWAKLERYDFQIVTKAFDQWVDSSKHAPTVFDILNLVRPKIEFQAALQAPKLTLDQNRMHAANVMQYVSENTPKEKKLKGMREWAHKILKNPKNYPAISLKKAQEAIRAK